MSLRIKQSMIFYKIISLFKKAEVLFILLKFETPFQNYDKLLSVILVTHIPHVPEA